VLFLILLGVFRLGFLANFLSHPVIAGFITASGILIAQPAASMSRHPAAATTCRTAAVAGRASGRDQPGSRFAIGVSATAFLFWVRKGLKPLLLSTGMKPRLAGVWPRPGRWPRLPSPPSWPGASISNATAGVAHRRRGAAGPAAADHALVLARSVGQLIGSAVLISIIGFVESVSVAQTLAAQETPAHRARPGTDRPGRRQCRRGVHRRLPGDRRLRPLGRELRRRAPKRLPPAPIPRWACCWPRCC
jgi:SulP family sulfate permease